MQAAKEMLKNFKGGYIKQNSNNVITVIIPRPKPKIKSDEMKNRPKPKKNPDEIRNRPAMLKMKSDKMKNEAMENFDNLYGFPDHHDDFKSSPGKNKVCDDYLGSDVDLSNHSENASKKYECKSCTLTFSWLSALRFHENTHNENKKSKIQYIEQDESESNLLKCKECIEVFENPNDLEFHHATEHSKGCDYACNICQLSFHSLINLERHSLKHTKEYKCEICSITFKSRGERKLHKEQEHSIIKTFYCSLCHDKFYDYDSLKDHEKVHAQEGYTCKTCPLTFRTNQELKDHMDEHFREMRYSCQICHAKNNSRKDLTHHMRTEHPEEVGLQCDMCYKVFPDTYRLKEHKHVHSEERNFKCKYCEKTFKRQSNLNDHLKTHPQDPRGERKYKCGSCEYRAIDKPSLRRHLRTHEKYSDEELKKFVCQICGLGKPDQRLLERHELTHFKEKVHLCNECGKKFKDPKGLRIHMMIHTGEMPYSCKVCSKPFRHTSTLKLHMTGDHGMGNYFKKCPWCDETFDKKALYVQHKEENHKTNIVLDCEHCDVKLKSHYAMVIHMKGHLNVKDILCQVCGKGFSCKSHLTQHMRKHGEKKHFCEVCSKLFARRNDLTSHMRIHTGEKPHVCKNCGERFTQHGSLNHHRKRCLK